MFNKKIILILTIIFVSLLAVSAVSASDNVTSEDLSIGLEDSDVRESSVDDVISVVDDSDDTIDNEEIKGTDNDLSKEYEDIIGVEENDANTIIGKEVTNDEPVLTSTDKDVLSVVPEKVKLTILKQTGETAKDKKIYFKVTDAKTGKAVYSPYEGLIMGYTINGVYGTDYVVTNSRGIGVLKWSEISTKGKGVYSLKLSVYAIWDDDSNYFEGDFDWGISCNDAVTKVTIRNVKQTVVIKPKKLSTSFKSGKYFKAKVINSKTKKPVKKVKIILKVYTGKKAKTVTLTSNSKGLIKYSSSKLKVGKHKVVLKVKKSKKFKGKTKKSSIKISKAKLKVSAPKVTAKYKKSKLFKVTVKNKKSGKPVKGIKVIMKVYTGKKYKKIVHKTNKKGKTGFNTKSLSKGKHKVVVIVKANSKYKKATAKSSLTIKKPKTTKSKSSKSKSSKSDKGKIKTEIIAKHLKLSWKDVPTGEYGYRGYPIYASAPDFGFQLILKAANGKEISGKYKANVYEYDRNNKFMKKWSFIDKYGEIRYSSGTPGISQYKIVVKYKGNSKYGASKFAVKSNRIKFAD